MSLPSDHPFARGFPIPVVAMGPGSQEDETPCYLPMPQGMDTFAAPRLPETADPAVLTAVAARLHGLLDRMAAAGFARAATVSEDLACLPPAEREALGQLLGFGEVSAYTVAPRHWRVQETAFASLWRVLGLDERGAIIEDRLQAGAMPPVLEEAMAATSSRELEPPAYPPGTMNAPALVQELRRQATAYQPGQPAHVINLTLLPVSEADLDTLYGWLGHREVSILSRGYGNCRITSTRLAHVWWVQYFNTMDALILNTIEVVDMPEVALAAVEDFEDTLERLRDYLTMLESE